jgi:hypothetical protein
MSLANTPYYFSTIRNLTAAFGTLFDNIHVMRYNNDGSLAKNILCPLAYSPTDKAIIMLQQRNPSIQNDEVDIKITLPRIGYELTGMAYDSTRKTQTLTQNIYVPGPDINFNSATAVNITTETINLTSHGLGNGKAVVYNRNGGTTIGNLTSGVTYYAIKVDSNNIKLATTYTNAIAGSAINLSTVGTGTQYFSTKYTTQFNPVPYTFDYTVSILVKYIDDGLQIIEQILPYFTPFYTISINDMLNPGGAKRDVPIVLNSITSEDIYQGDVADDRIITWTLNFTANYLMYPPVHDNTAVIKTDKINFLDMGNNQILTTTTVQVIPATANREDTYTVQTTISV